MLCIFRPNKLVRIETDTLDLVIGVYICQRREGKWHLVAYYSRKMIAPKQNYDIYNKELFVVVSALQNWRVYTESCLELTVYTDHKNLLSFIIIKQLNRR